MARPELPDDRRAQPRRPGAAAPSAPPPPPAVAAPPGGLRPAGPPRPHHPHHPPTQRPPTAPSGPGPVANGRPPRERAVPARGDDTAENGVVNPASTAEPPVPPPEPTDTSRRHRRRAGGSPDERPAAEYRDQLAASGRKARPGRRRRPTFWRELPVLIGVALLLTFLIQTFLAKVYVIPSGSMETTLHGCNGCVNDRVLVDKLSYRFGGPQPGDVVVFRGPDSWRNTEFTVPPTENPLLQGLQLLGSVIGLAPPDEKDFVKRVIAVGGQTVQCCDSRNRVVVDGEPLDEPYIYYDPRIGDPRQDPFGPVRVPEGELWMMGDSRNNSADSRVPGHGPVPVGNVIGKVQFIVLPIARSGGVEAIDPQTDAVGLGPATGGPHGPLALGVLGAVPLAVGRARRRFDDGAGFLPGRRRG